MRPALVVEHEPDAPAGLLADWAADRGIALEHARAADLAGGEGADRPFIVLLGSERSAGDDDVPWLAAERALLDAAVRGGVGVLGLCFGAQHLARALGGSVTRAARPEIGWLEVTPEPGSWLPAGPWAHWHRDAFTAPPGAELLARSPVGDQAFRLGPHLGVQFHPEATPAILEGWLAADRGDLDLAGTSPAAVRAAGAAHAAAAREAAFALFGAFVAGAGGPRGRMAPRAHG